MKVINIYNWYQFITTLRMFSLFTSVRFQFHVSQPNYTESKFVWRSVLFVVEKFIKSVNLFVLEKLILERLIMGHNKMRVILYNYY